MVNEERLYFDGNSNIEIKPLIKNISNHFTYEFWVKPEEKIRLVNENNKGTQGLIDQRFVIFPGHTENKFQSGVGVSVGTNGVVVVEHADDYFPATLVCGTELKEWSHISIVIKNKIPNLFINGEFVKKGVSSAKEEVFASGTIGGLKRYGFFVGKVKNVRLWDHALNIGLIQHCKDDEITGKENGLSLEWKGFAYEEVSFPMSRALMHGKGMDRIQRTGEGANHNNQCKIKLIAFYLPQFHEIPENNKWWGEGFTEWTNTKKSSPLFTNHYQPREPYQDYYYNLLDPSVREWQANLAKKYGIYGFCYYHYWFDGKMLLEKPFNEVLTSGKPDFPFCLSWANEPWSRRWDGSEDQVLMPQYYGREKDWQSHFNYLLRAFMDDRYIRVQDKPIFLIYRPELIPNCSEMLLYWNELAKQHGLEGIYFIRTLNGFHPLSDKTNFDASLEFEPHYTMAHGGCHRMWKGISGYNGRKLAMDYDTLWSCILNRSLVDNETKVIPGAFIDWDNTARLGENASFCVGANPTYFQNYLSEQIHRANHLYQSDLLFINAWNEWAEGTYLEPDKKLKFQYLEAVEKALRNNGYQSEGGK